MMKFGKCLLPCVLCLLLLAGCGEQHVQVVEAVITKGEDVPAEDVQPEEDPAGPEDHQDAEDPAGPEDSQDAEDPAGAEDHQDMEDPAAAEGKNLFEQIPQSYLFCSGAGGWGTELSIEPDGTFTGSYHDSDMGDRDETRYPNGTVYLCRFHGKFAPPEVVDETTWTVGIESLELEHPADGAEEIEDGIRYLYSEPFGLEGTEALTVYLPDTPAEGLDENILWAARGPYDWKPTEAGTLGLVILYNAAQDHGFVQYPYGGA